MCVHFLEVCAHFHDLCAHFHDLCAHFHDLCAQFHDLCAHFHDLCAHFHERISSKIFQEIRKKISPPFWGVVAEGASRGKKGRRASPEALKKRRDRNFGFGPDGEPR
jgi:hypothetical protein